MTAPSLTAFIQGQGACSADNLNTFEQTCDVVAQIREFIGLPGIQVYVRGISAPNDGGQGPFYWQAVVTEPDDNFNYIIPPGSATGGWVRLNRGISNRFYTNTALAPSGSSVGSTIMMGLGSTLQITPTLTGNIKFNITGYSHNDSATGIAAITPYYGTGNPPLNGASVTGTAMGTATRNPGSVTGSVGVNFNYYAEASGLAVGTPYWFDIGLSNGLGGSSFIVTQTVMIEEF